MEPRVPTALDDYLFDLRGYIILKDAVEPALVDELNRVTDTVPQLQFGEWYGNSQRRDYNPATGFELHNCIELGGPFEELIDHPGWIEYVRRYCGEQNSYVEGLFIDECILSVRGPSGHHPVHRQLPGGLAQRIFLQRRRFSLWAVQHHRGADRCWPGRWGNHGHSG